MSKFLVQATYHISHLIEVEAESEDSARLIATHVAAEYQSNTSPGVAKAYEWGTDLIGPDQATRPDFCVVQAGTGWTEVDRYDDAKWFCVAECGCAGAYISDQCRFDPNCSRCRSTNH